MAIEIRPLLLVAGLGLAGAAAPANELPAPAPVGDYALPSAAEAPDGPIGGELPTGLFKPDDPYRTPTPPPYLTPAPTGVAAGAFTIFGDEADALSDREGLWRLPVPGYVTSPYGKIRLLPVYRYRTAKVRNKKGKLVNKRRRVRIGRRRHVHKGIDLKAHTGDPIRAVTDAVVLFSGRAQGYGNCVYLLHPDGLETRYAHASRLTVRTGETVEAGQVIALAGSTGRSSGPHLHFEVRRDGAPVNPLPFLEAARFHEEGIEGDEEGEENETDGEAEP